MTQARSQQIDLNATPFYHCYVRCVRRAYLCGEDHLTGENFDHRKQWIVSRLKFLSYIYAIDVCAYAVMSNHYHVVLHVDKARALSWSKREVAERWMQLYKGDLLVNRWMQKPGSLDAASQSAVDTIIECWRERLYSLEWFMRGVNETIARMANEEDQCSGRFWEGRYKSQALLDEAALLSCMAYVDLNPVRAAMADDLASSDFTSIQQRIHEFSAKQNIVKKTRVNEASKRQKQQQKLEADLELDELPKATLMNFHGSLHKNVHQALPFSLVDYFELVDATGRQIRKNKRGFIASKTPKILQELGLDPDKWIEHIQHFGRTYSECVGSVESLKEFSLRKNKKWSKGVLNSNLIYLSA